MSAPAQPKPQRLTILDATGAMELVRNRRYVFAVRPNGERAEGEVERVTSGFGVVTIHLAGSLRVVQWSPEAGERLEVREVAR